MGKRIFLMFVIAVLVVAALPVSVGAQEDELTVNKALMETFLTEVLSAGGDLSVMDDIFAEDFVFHFVMGDELDLEAYRAFHAGNHAALPDLTVTDYLIIAEGDHIAAVFYMGGTFSSEWSGIPPTGEPFGFNVIDLFRVENGKVVEAWDIFHTLDFMQQLGAIPVESPVGPQEPWAIEFGESEFTSDEQVALVASHWEAIVTGDPAGFDLVFAPDVVFHSAMVGDMNLEESKTSSMELAAALELLDQQEITISEGNLVVTFSMVEGVFANEWDSVGVPPNGNLLQWRMANVNRIEDDQIVEYWEIMDSLSLFEQLTAPPAETDAVNEFPTGEFVREGMAVERRMVLNSDGSFTYSVDDVIYASGTYRIDGNQFIWVTDDSCEEVPMAYTWSYEENVLTLYQVEFDPCPNRRNSVHDIPHKKKSE